MSAEIRRRPPLDVLRAKARELHAKHCFEGCTQNVDNHSGWLEFAETVLANAEHHAWEWRDEIREARSEGCHRPEVD